jgi:hypothetical protein
MGVETRRQGLGYMSYTLAATSLRLVAGERTAKRWDSAVKDKNRKEWMKRALSALIFDRRYRRLYARSFVAPTIFRLKAWMDPASGGQATPLIGMGVTSRSDRYEVIATPR